MKKLFSLVIVAVALSLGVAHAEEKAKTSQQNKMAMCNKEATGKKGAERKGFMKTCLSAAKATSQAK